MSTIGLFEHLGFHVMNRIKTPKGLLAIVIIVSGSLSAFMINDIVCLLFTPVVISLCRRAKLLPVPYLLAVALASNIGSAATLIGNPQNILIGSLSHISFAWYFMHALPLSIVGLLFSYTVLAKVYTNELSQLIELSTNSVRVKPIPRFLLIKGAIISLGVVLGFILGLEPAVVASFGATILLITRRLKPNKIYAGIDYNLLVIFIGLFVVVGGVEQSGLLNQLLDEIKVTNIQLFMVLTVILSNVVSNVPAVMLLQYLIPSLDSSVWWGNLAIFSTLAGNLTITGSIANLIVIELAKKQGIHIGFWDYLRIGFPITIALVLIGMGYVYVIF
jgi:Na+/H+ antiporter NhaD/arsenite permease-like protein